MNSLTATGKTLLVATFGLRTRTPTMLTRLRKPPGKLATIEVRYPIVRTGFCRVDDKVLSLGMTDFFLSKNNTMRNMIDLESEVSKSAALIELLSDRLCREIEERGGSHAETTAAGIVAMAIDQSGNLVRTFYAACDEAQSQRSVRN